MIDLDREAFVMAVIVLAVGTALAAWLWARRLRADSAAKDVEIQRMTAFIESSSDWTWEQDADLRFTFVSPSIEAVLGVPAKACLGKTREEIDPDALDALGFAALQQVSRRHAPIRRLRLRRTHVDGRHRFIEIDGDPVFAANGDFRGYRGVARDVTALVEAEREATDMHRRFINAIEARVEGISFWDRDDRLRLFNSAYLTLAPGAQGVLREGVRFEDYIRASVNSGQIPDASDRGEEWIQERMRLRRNAPSSFEVVRGDRWLKVSELRTADGWVLHTTLDITDAKEREAAMRRAVAEAEIANRSKMEFLAVMSHELRTPLNAIIGFSDVIRNRVLGDAMDTYMRYAEHINESGSHLLALINDLLDVSRIEAGRLELEETEFGVAELARECTRMLRVRADDKEVDLTLDASDADLALVGDRRAVKQIVLNLASNAIKFTPEGGAVRLDMSRDDRGRVELTVTDTGIGIPADRQEIIFRPFEQLENAHARRHDGTGLGLYITRNLVEAHGGSIHLESVVDEGTTVTVLFPAERTKPLAAKQPVSATSA